MNVIIAGSGSVGRRSADRWDYETLAVLLQAAISESGWKITEGISGGGGRLRLPTNIKIAWR